MSTSTFTMVPATQLRRFVRASVSGMMHTRMESSNFSATVRLMPFREMEPRRMM